MTAAIILQFIAICGIENVIDDKKQMHNYVTDWRNRYSGEALALLFPANASQISAIVKLCRKHDITITPQGGNTSTCGGATPLTNSTRAQIIVNLARMNRILAVDPANQSISAEAGCTLLQVQEAAVSHQLYFPLSIASQSSCQIGGNLATNAGGIQVLKYGMMRDLTLGLEAVLADGSILAADYKLRKNNTYLDLKQLLIGSEGTLGIITKATLKLYPQPRNLVTFLIGVNSIANAIKLLANLRNCYLNNVSAFEIIKKDSQELYNRHFPQEQLPLTANWLVLGELEIAGDFDYEHFGNVLSTSNINPHEAIIATTGNMRQELWAIREKIPLAEKMEGYAAKHDISLPLSTLEQFVKSNMPKLQQMEPGGYFSIFGHLGDGNLHYNFGIANASEEAIRQLEAKISPLVYEDVVAHGGSIAAEHGIGQAKKHYFKQFMPASSYQLAFAIKELLDPQNILNPGKIL